MPIAGATAITGSTTRNIAVSSNGSLTVKDSVTYTIAGTNHTASLVNSHGFASQQRGQINMYGGKTLTVNNSARIVHDLSELNDLRYYQRGRFLRGVPLHKYVER